MVDETVPVIAIDGPSASGKGTVAQRVAEKLGYHYLDSGALYRLVALAAIRSGLDLENEAAVAELAGNLDAGFEGEEIFLDGERVTDAIRSEECGNGASRIATLPKVRDALLSRQRAFHKAPGLVAEGRDMGSRVFPDAVLKIFLTASAGERAKRRYKQLIDKGMYASITTLLQDIRERDERDARRSVAPLQQCADASLLDTTSLTIDEAVAEVVKRFGEVRTRKRV